MASIVAWFMAHQLWLGAIVVAVIDLVFAAFPALAANGILHQILIWAQAMAKPAAK